MRNLPPVFMQVLIKYCENGPTTPATYNAVEMTTALLVYASSLFRKNGGWKSGNIPRHDPHEGDISVEDELVVFFVRSTTSGKGDLAVITILVGALEELRAIVFFLNEEQINWHLIVAHLLCLHHIKSSCGSILLFHFKLRRHGLNFTFQLFLM